MNGAAAAVSILTIAISAVSSLIGAVIGIAATHWLASKRDREQKRREFALKYLIEAWQQLEEGCRDTTDIHRKSEIFEKCIADIQIFGSNEQIEMASRWTEEMVTQNRSQATPLLRDFQQSIRSELGLSPSPVPLFFFRLTPLSPKESTDKKVAAP